MFFYFKWLLVQLYRGKTIFICLWDGAVHFVLDQLSWILIVIIHKNNNVRRICRSIGHSIPTPSQLDVAFILYRYVFISL